MVVTLSIRYQFPPMPLSNRYTFYTVPGNTSETVSGDFSTLLGLSGESSLDTPTLTATGLSNFLIADPDNASPTYLRSNARRGAYTTLIGNGSSTLVGGVGNDFFKITSLGDILMGGALGGNDTLSSAFGTIDLSSNGTTSLGNDVTMVANAVYTGLGGATITGNSLPGILKGGSLGGNSLVAGSASQTLIGGNPSSLSGSAADTLQGNGRSYLMGGSGDNLYLINNRGDRIVQPSGSGISQILTTLTSFSLTDTVGYGNGLLNVRNLIFDNNSPSPSRTVSLSGNSLNNTIVGSSSTSNVLTAGKGSRASLVAGDAGDTLIGNGFSTLVGGRGANLYYVSGSSNGFSDSIIDAGSVGSSSVVGVPQGSTPFYYDLSKANQAGQIGTVTRLSYPGTANATLIGNTLSSNTSRDTLIGGSGKNSLFAGAGGSLLIGGNKGNYFSDSLASASYATTMQGGAANDTFYVSKGNNLIQDSRGQYGGIDEIQTPLTYFNLSDTIVAGGVGVENLTYVGTLSTSLVGNSLNNIIDATRNTVPASGITLNGNGGFDTLRGSRVSPNYFLVPNPTSLGNNFQVTGSTLNDTLAITAGANLRDTIFGNNGVRYISGIENVVLSSPSNAVIGANAAATGVTKVVLGAGPDTINASGYSLSSGITLDASANVSTGDILTGSTLVGTAFLLSSAAALQASTLTGALATRDTLAFVTPLDLYDSSFTPRITGMDLLSVSGGSFVSIGSNAQSSGITTVAGGIGNATISAAGYTNSITIDVSGSAPTDIESLVGSSTAGTRFVLSSSALAASSTFVGGSGIDTLSFVSPVNLNGSNLSNLSAIEVLQLTSPSSVVIPSSLTGLSSVVGGTGADTIDASGYASALTLNASAVPSTIGDSLIGPGTAAGTFVFSNPTAMTSSTVRGGAASDTLLVSSAATLNDSLFSTRISAVEALVLTGASQITLGSGATAAGFGSVFGGAGNSSYSLGGTGPSSASLLGGARNDSFIVSSATTLGSASISGGAGTDTLSISSAGTFNDNFARVSGVEVLTLSGSSAVTLGSAAASAGLSTVFGSASNSTFVQAQNNTFGAGNAPASMTLIGGTGNDLFSIYGTSYLSADSIVGGAGLDTLFLATASSLNDSFANVSGIEALSLAGPSAVTLGSAAQVTGITAVTFSSTLPADNSTLTHLANDTLPVTATGGAGSDLFIIANSTILQGDSLVGGAGADTLSLSTPATLNDAFGRIRTMEALSLTGASAVTLNSAAGTAGIVSVFGGNGNSTYVLGGVGPGTATISAGTGNDLISFATSAQIGTASLSGGTGTDTLAVTSAATLNNTFARIAGVEVLSLTGASQVTLGSSGQTAGISTVIGSIATTSINASAYTASVTISNGTSTVPSGLSGGTAADSILGGTAADTIQGYSGFASLNSANDSMRGGAGADRFIMATATDTTNAYGRGGANSAFISDFTPGTGNDILQLKQFGGGASGYSSLLAGSNLSIYATNTQIPSNLVAVLTLTGGSFDWTSNAAFV